VYGLTAVNSPEKNPHPCQDKMSVVHSLDTFSHVTEESHPSSHIVKKELFDADIMKSVLSDERFAAVDRARLKRYYKARSQPNEVRVVYNYGKGYEMAQLGRLYPDGGLGLQSFPKEIRDPLTAKNYWEVDIANAHYMFACKLAQNRGLCCDAMRHYIENRDTCLTSVASDRGTAKIAFLRILYGGDITLHDNTLHEDQLADPDGDISFLVALKQEVDALIDHIWLEYDAVRKRCLRKHNPKASVFSIVLQSIERDILMRLDMYFAENGRSMDILIHDGGRVRKLDGESIFPDELLRGAEEFITDETGYAIRLAIKPIEHTYDSKPEVLYVAEGVSVDAFHARKTEFEQNHFYLRENGTVCEVQTDGCLLMMDHSLAMSNMANNVFEYRKESLIKRTGFFPLWMSCRERREFDCLVYRPDGVCADGEYNTLLPFVGGLASGAIDGRDGLTRFLDIALNLVNGNREHCDYLLKWIALKLQQPWIVPGVCVVFTGAQGIGKTTFWNFIGNRLIGRKQYVYTDDIIRDIFDKHSEAQMSNLLCVMEEASSSLTRKLANELKAKITATHTRINPKDIRPFSIDTFLSWVLLTNDASPVKLESGDRRYCVFNTGSAHKGDYAYWSETARLLEAEETVAAVFTHLMSLDLSGFVVQMFPITELREIMLDGERSPEEMFLREMAGEMVGDEWRGTNQEFYRLYVDWCRRYEIRPKSAVGFGRDMTPYVLKGWVGKWGSHGNYGKQMDLGKIRMV
jgi:hypothetical protein